jgi:hypothetical protein
VFKYAMLETELRKVMGLAQSIGNEPINQFKFKNYNAGDLDLYVITSKSGVTQFIQKMDTGTSASPHP